MTDALIDFHFHSTCSDGTWEPTQLFDHIRQRNIEYFCLSDHDGMDAYPVPPDLRASCVPGLEIDTHADGRTAHILGYGISDREGPLLRRLAEQRKSREHRAYSIIERLNRLGIPLTFEQVCNASAVTTSIGRPHIGRALVAMKHCDNLQEAFDKYLAEGRDGYVPLERLTTAEAVDLVHQAGGVAVLAHPQRLGDPQAIHALCDLSIDGIEVVHPTADRQFQDYLYDLVDKLDLFATGGSDFHGRPQDQPIGVSFPRPRLKKMLERLPAISGPSSGVGKQPRAAGAASGVERF